MASDTAEDTSGVEASGIGTRGEPGPTWSTVNAAVIVLFTLLTLVGILLSMGLVGSLVEVGGTEGVMVPAYVYLYAGLGALGYIFTKLMVSFDRYDEWRDAEALASMLMRVPAALVLAAGVYLLVGDLAGIDAAGAGSGGGNGSSSGTGDARFLAGVAFLVGLYVNVALKSLGSLADRILGRGARQSDSNTESDQG